MDLKEKLESVEKSVNTVIRGKEDVVEKVLATFIAGGHILMEDIPGVGKTTLAMAFARSLSLDYKRVQFTPDVLPSDLLGFSMYNEKTRDFEYRPGTVFTNLLLADEINRTSPKTQSALLEVMEEGTATVDGVTRDLPRPFLVIATENPYGSSGTQMLPDSQLDRFMTRLSMGYPDHRDAVAILKNDADKPLTRVRPAMTVEDLLTAQETVRTLHVEDRVYDYVVTLVEKTRTDRAFSMGASPRGTIALLDLAKGLAVIRGRDFVTAEDVQDACLPTLGHRVKLAQAARARGESLASALEDLTRSVRPFAG